MEKHELELVTSTCTMSYNVLLQDYTRHTEEGLVVLRELVMELAQATRCRRVRSKKRKGAVNEYICETPRLRPSAIRKRRNELREAKQVDALTYAGL
jgi:hypothetical protein